MTDSNDLSLKTNECINSLTTMESNLSIYLGELGLPNDNIFVSMTERGHFFRSAPYHLEKLDIEKKSKSIYISKFFAAISSGLFDAALNYLWNETINDLRQKIEKFNLDFFISTIEVSDKQREKLNKSKDLADLQDYDLIKGARKITLISEIGFKELEHINYMRNWASAAHYNNTDLTATKLLYYFEICLKEVISLPTPVIIADINKFFIDIKDRKLEKTNILITVGSFENLSKSEIENLINGLFGIYTDENVVSHTTENINIFLSSYVEKISDNIKEEIGLRYASFKANNMEAREHKARDFLKLIKGEGFIPDDIRITEINVALDELLSAHYSNGNFHTEPILASQLDKIIGEYGKTPKVIEQKYVNTIIDVFLTNGLSNARNADPYYKKLIKNFNTNQVNLCILSFINDNISNKLQYNLCRDRFINLLDLIEEKIIDENIKKLVNKLKKYKESLDKLKTNPDFLKDLENLKLL